MRTLRRQDHRTGCTLKKIILKLIALILMEVDGVILAILLKPFVFRQILTFFWEELVCLEEEESISPESEFMTLVLKEEKKRQTEKSLQRHQRLLMNVEPDKSFLFSLTKQFI